mgnify:CR=1 FL=1
MTTTGTPMQPTDHDLLVEIKTLLEHQTVPQLQDHENRIRRLEKAVWIAAGIATAAGSTIGTALGGVLGA